MSVIVKNMEMPTSCKDCIFQIYTGTDTRKCRLSGSEFYQWDVGWGDGTENQYIRHKDCPLKELPPHGRLIDADALVEKHGDWYTEEGTEEGFIGTIKNLIATIQTIIPAEEGDN